MGDRLLINEGSFVKATERVAQIFMSEAYLGHVINCLAQPIDSKSEILVSKCRLVEFAAPPLVGERSPSLWITLYGIHDIS